MASRLIDKLLANNGIEYKHRQLLTQTVVITADNIADYAYKLMASNPDGTVADMHRKLPMIAPPFPLLFIQYVDPVNNSQFESGFIVKSSKRDDKNGWDIRAFSFDSLGQKVAYLGEIETGINKEGEVDVRYPYIHLPAIYPEEMRQEQADILMIRTIYIWWTLAFMNTKNVIMEAVEPNAAINKKRVKHGKLPLMRYHVLKIKPMGRETNDLGGTHASPALHIRRGHFKTYTDAAPLFGKLVGTFWVDQHIAGKKSDRVVVKDYEVLAGG